MNRKDQNIANYITFFGGLMLSMCGFPIINFILVALYSFIAEGTWRLPFGEHNTATAFVSYWITIIPWIFLLRRYKKWAGKRDLFRIENRTGRQAQIVLAMMLLFFSLCPQSITTEATC